ncbi:MAG: peptide deformylase [Spirochaetaceae bacterium]|jgi:peptide deformylase|nr:peptide deformylase [Spirochaetaceae bacterium]
MKVLRLGDLILRRQAEAVQEVNDEIRALIADMFVDLDRERGIGLAAPQVGKSIRLFVIKVDDNIERVFINPQIIGTSQEMVLYEEGCLSIPKVWEKILRPSGVTVQALNERGRPFTLEADGLLARVIQHEYDHLNGILFIDRAKPEVREKVETAFAEKARKEAEWAAAKQETEKTGRKKG